jgi:putative toxin-antitoxin system antitoxin component (TIGR02293 family)
MPRKHIEEREPNLKDWDYNATVNMQTGGNIPGHSSRSVFITILWDTPKKAESHMSSFEKMEVIKEGISKKSLEYLKEKSGLDYDQLASTLSIGRATLINKKKNEKFSQSVSERILSVADIYSYGYEVFEDTERFNEWIFRPNKALGGQRPYDLLNNQFGREELKALIGRIEYGVYS